MNQLDRMPEITEHVLAGLKADDSLKHRILLSASENRSSEPTRKKTVLALCFLSVLLILLCVFAARMPSWQSGSPDLHIIPAGSHRIISPVNLRTVIDQASGIQENETKTGGTD